ncbi:MAG: sigma-70 family RNA polymerase sigma factor [Leptospiraceae bacterium]|nr:sigma-70 family RNA polymerase sigma factor [Leptospiraceae bacterium]
MEELYQKYCKRIFDYLYKYTGNEETAMDLMQDTFTNFFRIYGKSNLPEDKSIMLLYTIAKNSSINYSKKFSTRKELSVVDTDYYGSQKNSFEKKEELKDMEQKLRDCLLLLPEEQRTAIILKNMEGMTLSQISDIMNLSISTISRLVVKATARLIELAEEREIFPD